LPELPVPPDAVPETCWPTVRLMDATVPAMVEVRVASLREFCAEVSAASAAVTSASSAAICAEVAVEEFWSWESLD